jgi:hypothetical protein
MISPSAGYQSKEQFLADFLERMKEKRVPGPGDSALRGEVRNDIIGKVERGVLKV